MVADSRFIAIKKNIFSLYFIAMILFILN